MIKEVTRIILFIAIALNHISGQGISMEATQPENGNRSVSQPSSIYLNGNGVDEARNRLPQLLRDVKILLTEAVIADVYHDTLEVIYYLDNIYELLGEADQLGEKTEEDQEEFDRFVASLNIIYTTRLHTLELSDAPISAAYARQMIEEIILPVEMEMGNSKFIVVDDRDGHIPLVRNKAVDQFISYFQKKGKKQFQVWLDRMPEFSGLINDILREQELPGELLYLAMIESGLNPKAYSKASALGIWQFVYSTGKYYGLKRDWYVDERRDPIKSTYAACAYLRDLYEEFDHWYLALAAYNFGPGRIRRAIRLHQTSDFWQLHSLPKETRNYIPYYMAAAIIAKSPEEYGFDPSSNKRKSPFEFDLVELEKSADLSVLARASGISLKTIKNYNPELRQSATPNNGPYLLRIPKGMKDQFTANFNALPEDQRFAPQYIVHKVRRGESLWTISKKYKVSIHNLAAVNKIRNRHRIKIGEKLTIPVRGVYATHDGPPGHIKVVYTVRRGDTLGHIAQNYGTRASKIRRWNKISYGQNIYPGQKLVLWVKQG
ncbi:MAG: LysM peptidoglycan-binding domain-containing protein [Candidatus Marinimicrobia bacterium]|nr:LysM peptidoglycan-binding domain-containing protein [Candidatus Neomarinimicrobiota bacterium]